MRQTEARPHRHPLTVEARVVARSNHGSLSIRGDADVIAVTPDTWRCCWGLLRTGIGSPRLARLVGLAHEGLDRAGLTLEVRCKRWLIFRLGQSARGALAGRIPGAPGIELGWAGLVLAAASRLTNGGSRATG